MSKKLLFALLCLLAFSCSREPSYRLVKVVDTKGSPLEYVQPFPQQIFGLGSKVSDSKGMIFIPIKSDATLKKSGYKPLQIKPTNSSKLFTMHVETRSYEEIISDQISILNNQLINSILKN